MVMLLTGAPDEKNRDKDKEGGKVKEFRRLRVEKILKPHSPELEFCNTK